MDHHPAPHAQPHTTSPRCLGCGGRANGAQWPPACRGVRSTCRDHPSTVLAPVAGAGLLLPALRCCRWEREARPGGRDPRVRARLLGGRYTWVIEGGRGTEPCPVLSPLPPVRTLSAAMAFHASTLLRLSAEEPGDSAGPQLV